MEWRDKIKQRYSEKGWDAFREARQAFKNRLERFFLERGISPIDDNPEGKDWMVLLKDGTELYVEGRSYDTTGPQIELWIGFSHEERGVVAQLFDESGRPSGHEVIIPNTDIAAVSDEL